MCTGLTTTKNWGASLSQPSPSYLRPAIPLQLRLLTLPRELRFTILEYVVADNIIPALKYSEFCRSFLPSTPSDRPRETKYVESCTCQTSMDSHSPLHVNRQLRQEYFEVLKQNANIIICHCTLFSRICVLEQSLSSIKERLPDLKQLSISVKSPIRSNVFFGDDMVQTWPYRDYEHKMALTSLGVHLTMFLTINCIESFATLEHLSILWEINKEKTFQALDERDMETALQIVLWKTRGRLTRLRGVDVKIEHGRFWKNQRWARMQGVWKTSETLKSSC